MMRFFTGLFRPGRPKPALPTVAELVAADLRRKVVDLAAVQRQGQFQGAPIAVRFLISNHIVWLAEMADRLDPNHPFTPDFGAHREAVPFPHTGVMG